MEVAVRGVFWLVRNSGGAGSTPEEREAPEDVLKRRLAAREISIEAHELHGALSRKTPAEPPEPALH